MFDPYRKWLGITAKDQPPNHYRLLGLELFESDLDVVEGAADKQMGHVRQYQSGEHAADAARILNELAIARLCLLKPATKVAYDEKLRKQTAAAEPEPVFPEGSLFSDDTPLLPPPRKKGKSKRSQSVVSRQQMMLGGGIAAVLLLAVVFFSSRGPRQPTPKPAESSEIANAASTTQDVKPTANVTAPASRTMSSAPDSNSMSKAPDSKSFESKESPLLSEPAGTPVDLLKLVDLKRDVVAGRWEQTTNGLVSERSSRIYLPVKLSEDYQLRYTIRLLEGADTLSLGFMMGGRQGVVALDSYRATASGLYLDGCNPDNNCTTRRGKLFDQNQPGTVVLTVHPRHFHAAFNGKTFVNWYGDPQRLSLDSAWNLACRESPYVIAIEARYAIELATMTPIKPEAEPAPIARLDREIDILPLMDVDRDVIQGVWSINKNTLRSPENLGKIYVPGEVPEEYSLSMTAELPAEHEGDFAFAIGLFAHGSQRQISCTLKHTGFDTIDGKLLENNDTTTPGPLLKPGTPVHLVCTVTKSGIRLEADGKSIINWKGDFRRLSSTAAWSVPDGRRLYLGSWKHLKLRDIKLGPPLPPPKLPEHLPRPSRPIDLLALIDPTRDAYIGTWERDGTSVICRGDQELNKLAIPFELPDEYKLTVRVARLDGGKVNTESLWLFLPAPLSTTNISVDGLGSTFSGADFDGVNYSGNALSYRGGPILQKGKSHEVVAVVSNTRRLLTCDGKTIFDWKGDPRRFSYDFGRWPVAGRLTIGSWAQRFRFEKIEIEQLPESHFPEPPALGADGDLLATLDMARDSRFGDWKLAAGKLTAAGCVAGSPANSGSRPFEIRPVLQRRTFDRDQ